MQSKSIRSLVSALSLMMILVGCESDIEVIAPKKDMTIIYGLLEANQTRHYIRINRSFVGEEAASTLAAETGINEYTDAELAAKIIELNSDGSTPTGAEWNLAPIYIYDKEAGDFANDSNKVYYFDATLNPERYYKISCKVKVEGEDEKTVTAVTDILGNQSSTGSLESIRLVSPKLSGNSNKDRTQDEVRIFNKNSQDYAEDFQVEWTSVNGGVRYTTFMRLYYRDYDNATGFLIKHDSVTLAIGSKNFEGAEGQVTFPSVNTTNFYANIGRQVNDLDTTNSNESTRRIVSDTVQFFLQVGNDELSTYIEINQPVSSVVQQRPEYTNVQNGVGIFASRFVTSTRTNSTLTNGRILDAASLEELLYCESTNSGRYTVSKSFTRPGRCVVKADGSGLCQ